MPVNTRIATRRGIGPVGTIIPFYDFNGLLDFDTKTWAYCNGQVLADADSPLNGQTLPDLSGRYLVGFGTDGNALMGVANWSVVPIGNAGHTIDVYHRHNYTHRHTLNSHTHGPGTLKYKAFTLNSTDNVTLGSQTWRRGRWTGWNAAGTSLSLMGTKTTTAFLTPYVRLDYDGPLTPIWQFYSSTGDMDFYTSTSDGNGSTGAAVGDTTDSVTPTDYSLSATQSIQPRSIRVRYLIRIA